MDLRKLNDEELDQHRISVLIEIQRRQDQAKIPRQVESLVEKFAAGGGDMQVLIDCVNDPRHIEEGTHG